MNRCKITSQITNIDCIDGMKQLDNNSIDGIITDPPYGLGFMGKEWDTFDKNQFGKKGNEGKNDLKVKKDFKMVPWYKTDGLYDFTKVWATEGLRVLKPGGHLLSFAGSRTYHKIACAIEDVGFEIRDQIMWIYGSGFPKSLNIEKQLAKNSISEEAKQWEGWGTALKPAHEPIVVARKPLSEKNVALNVLKWGTAGINIDECRIETDEDTKRPLTTPGYYARGEKKKARRLAQKKMQKEGKDKTDVELRSPRGKTKVKYSKRKKDQQTISESEIDTTTDYIKKEITIQQVIQ